VVVEAGVKPGNLLPHIVAGDAGKVDIAYFSAVDRPGKKPAWYSMVAQSLNALDAAPTWTKVKLSNVATYADTPEILMGACNTGPTAPTNGVQCGRATDVYGIALDQRCNVLVTWPGVSNDAGGGAAAGTFVASQTAGPSLCGPAAAAETVAVPSPSPAPVPLPGTSVGRFAPSWALATLLLALALLAGAALMPRGR
jgi:hypothetical protein